MPIGKTEDKNAYTPILAQQTDSTNSKLTSQLHKMRAIATGGVLKEHLRDLEDEPDGSMRWKYWQSLGAI